MSSDDDEIQRRAAELEQKCDREGFIVTVRHEIEAAGVAWHLDTDTDQLRRWRDVGLGPTPSRTVRRVAFYESVEVIRWIDRAVHTTDRLESDMRSRATCAPGGARR